MKGESQMKEYTIEIVKMEKATGVGKIIVKFEKNELELAKEYVEHMESLGNKSYKYFIW